MKILYIYIAYFYLKILLIGKIYTYIKVLKDKFYSIHIYMDYELKIDFKIYY